VVVVGLFLRLVTLIFLDLCDGFTLAGFTLDGFTLDGFTLDMLGATVVLEAGLALVFGEGVDGFFAPFFSFLRETFFMIFCFFGCLVVLELLVETVAWA